MKRILWTLLLVPLTVVGGDSWVNELECKAELIRMEAFLTDKTETTSFKRFPLSKFDHLGTKKGSGRFDFGGGVYIYFEAELQKGKSQWSRYGDRLVVKSWFLQAGLDGREDTLYSYDERDSDQVHTFYKLRMAKKQKEKIFTISYMSNPQIFQHLFETTFDETQLLQERIVDRKEPYKGHLICNLWRFSADPSLK